MMRGTGPQKKDVLSLLWSKFANEARRFKTRRLRIQNGENGADAGGKDALEPQKISPHTFNPPSEAAMLAAYAASGADKSENTFVLYRILGNDLTPRQAKGQTRSNLKFILENEAEFSNCEKRFVLNRIVDADERARIEELLNRHGATYSTIPFEAHRYLEIEWQQSIFPSQDFVLSPAFQSLTETRQDVALALMRQAKNLYAVDNNGARNFALREGRGLAKWVLPFDGSCFFTPTGFEALRSAAVSAPYIPYFIVPMQRVTENADLLKPKFRTAFDAEPQIAFRFDAPEAFDEAVPYGRRPKVDLLWRLGVPGVWNEYRKEPWDKPQPAPSNQIGWHKSAGWVARLNSGQPELETSRKAPQRMHNARVISIITFLDQLDGMRFRDRTNPEDLALYDPIKVKSVAGDDPELAAELRIAAQEAMERGPYSVFDKTGTAPSGDKRDYFSQAPYWWPNPDTKDGLPYVNRDGVPHPGTRLFSSGSEVFDRSAFQRLCDDSTLLTLAGKAFGEAAYFEYAAALVRSWFLDPATAMNPNLTYAQMRMGHGRHGGNGGNGRGIVDFRDLVRVLDSVRLLTSAGAMNADESRRFRQWVSDFATWLQASPEGLTQQHMPNNHGTYYDLLLAAIARFLGDEVLLAKARNWARLRLSIQIAQDGSLPRELVRTKPAHYVAFTLTAWNSLARVFEGTGEDVWSWKSDAEGASGLGLAHAYQWLIDALAKGPISGPEEHGFDPVRLVPLWSDCLRKLPEVSNIPEFAGAERVPLLKPDYSILPFWQLAR
ncbi:MAG: alginate lyase family protein [Pseudomonadota bacterium]